jgi:hypothetical protein
MIPYLFLPFPEIFPGSRSGQKESALLARKACVVGLLFAALVSVIRPQSS